MNMTHHSQDWDQSYLKIRTRFPHLDEPAVHAFRKDRGKFAEHLARTHQLTLNEAREEFEDFLYLESLSNEIDSV